MSNGFWGNMWISCFFIATFHQIAVYSLCLGRSWILIHLMLKFICTVHRCWAVLRQISKHPMLKFIFFFIKPKLFYWHFKTSHVKVYRQSYSTKQLCTLISKHLMLKFILRLFNMWRWWNVISKHLMLKFILQVDIFFWYLFKFQNIPC